MLKKKVMLVLKEMSVLHSLFCMQLRGHRPVKSAHAGPYPLAKAPTLHTLGSQLDNRSVEGLMAWSNKSCFFLHHVDVWDNTCHLPGKEKTKGLTWGSVNLGKKWGRKPKGFITISRQGQCDVFSNAG